VEPYIDIANLDWLLVLLFKFTSKQFLTAACCPRRDSYTHTPLPPIENARLLYCILKKTRHLYCVLKQTFVLHTQKSTSFVLRTQKSTLKVGKKGGKKDGKIVGKKIHQKRTLPLTQHTCLSSEKNFLKHILEPVMLLS